MEALEALQHRLRMTEELGHVVRTMKVLAAANIHLFEQAVSALADYSATLRRGLKIVLGASAAVHPLVARRTLEPAAHGPLGLIAIGSDQGLCGQLNERVAERAATRWPNAAQRAVVGIRLADKLGAPSALSVPSTLESITPRVQDLVLMIERWVSEGVQQVWLVYARSDQAAGYTPTESQLLPLDAAKLEAELAAPWPGRMQPACFQSRGSMFSALIRQTIFISISRAMCESLAAENNSRLLAMQTAERNVDEMRESLLQDFNAARQDVISTELSDLMAGFEALKPTGHAHAP